MENSSIAIWKWINFIGFLVVAIYALRKPLKRGAEKDRDQFLANIKSAQSLKNEAAQQKATIDSRLSQLTAEIEEIKRQSEIMAQKQAEQIIARAKLEAENIRKEAELQISHSTQEAVKELKSMIALKTKEIVSSKIRSELTAKDQLKMIEKQKSYIV